VTDNATPTFALDLDQLEANSILRSIPSWKDVQAARDRLNALRTTQQPYDLMEADRDAVQQYSTILQRSANTIAMGILLGVHLGRLSRAASPKDRFGDGLRALAEGLDLRTLDETDTNQQLARCVDAAFPGAAFDFRTAMPVPPEALAAWLKKLQEALSAIHGLPPVRALDVRQRAWKTWLTRCAAVMSGTADVPADIDYLRCRAEGSAAGTILSANTKILTLREWGDAYIRSMSTQDTLDTVPLGFTAGVIAAMGFDLSPGFYGTMPKSQDLEDARAAFTRTDSVSRKGLVIVRVQSGSMTTVWRPVQTIPTLSVTAGGLHGATRVDLRSYLASRLHGVLIEIDSGESIADAFLRVNDKAIRSLFPGVRLGVLARSRPDPVPQGIGVALAGDGVVAAVQAFEPVAS